MQRLAGIAAWIVMWWMALTVHDRVDTLRAAFPPEEDVLYVAPPQQLRLMSLGYREALADLLWIRALIFAGTAFSEGNTTAIVRYVDAITGLAPHFHRAYTWGGIMVIYSGSETISREMVDGATVIYRRGLDRFPESHELLYGLGMLLVNQIPSTPGYDDDEVSALRDEGIEMIRRAAAFGADPLVRRYAATLVTEDATSQLSVAFLESQLAFAHDDAERRLIRKKLAEIGNPTSYARVDAIRRTFRKEHHKHAPYLPESIWALVRPDRLPPLDGPTPD